MVRHFKIFLNNFVFLNKIVKMEPISKSRNPDIPQCFLWEYDLDTFTYQKPAVRQITY